MRPTLRQLQYLVAIADTGRFGEAAKRCNVSQPSMSVQVADMEAELGVTLIERGRHGAIITPVGQLITTRARLILKDLSHLKALARQDTSEMSGRFILGVLPSVGPYLLPMVTKRLHASYPNLKLGVSELRTVDLAERLTDGRLDMIISTPEDHKNISSVQLLQENLYICTAPDDVLAQDQGAVSVVDLEGRSLLSLGDGHRLSKTIHQLADISNAQVSSEYEGTSLDAVRQMAAMGTGVAILPSLYAISEAKRDPDLIVRPIAHPMARRYINLIWRQSSPLQTTFEAMGEVFKNVAEEIMR